jgi:hypothetical protein
VLIGAVLPLAVAGNIARIMAVIVVAEIWGQDAGAKVETNLGFLTFAVAFVGMLLIEGRLREPSPQRKDGPSAPPSGESKLPSSCPSSP